MTLDEELRHLMQELTDEETAELLSAVSAPVDPEAEARIRRSVLSKQLSASAEKPVIRHRFRLLATAAAIVCPVVLSVAAVYLFSKKPQTPPVLPDESAVTAGIPGTTDVRRSESTTPDGTAIASTVTAQTTQTVSVSSEDGSVTDYKVPAGSTDTGSADPGSAASVQTTSQSQSVSQTTVSTTVSQRQTTTSAPASTESAYSTAPTTFTVPSLITSVSRTTTVSTTAPNGTEDKGLSGGKGGENSCDPPDAGGVEGTNAPTRDDQGGCGPELPDETTTTTTTTAVYYWPPYRH